MEELIQIQKEVKDKIAQLTNRIDESDSRIEQTILDMLKQTKRGRFFIWLLGYRDPKERFQNEKNMVRKVRQYQREIDKLNGGKRCPQ